MAHQNYFLLIDDIVVSLKRRALRQLKAGYINDSWILTDMPGVFPNLDNSRIISIRSYEDYGLEKDMIGIEFFGINQKTHRKNWTKVLISLDHAMSESKLFLSKLIEEAIKYVKETNSSIEYSEQSLTNPRISFYIEKDLLVLVPLMKELSLFVDIFNAMKGSNLSSDCAFKTTAMLL